MPAEVEESWSRVTAWLAANAPVAHAMLRPPASALDARLPVELRRLLLINDGADESERTGARFLPGMHRLLPADQIAADNAMHIEILADFDDDEMVGHWWHPRWIAFGSDAAGHRLVIDDRPGPGRGKVWEWSRTDGLIWEFAPSLAEFLADVATALGDGTPLYGWRPVVESGDVDWEPVTARGGV
jgi:cell wall assembly regulator SMI1